MIDLTRTSCTPLQRLLSCTTKTHNANNKPLFAPHQLGMEKHLRSAKRLRTDLKQTKIVITIAQIFLVHTRLHTCSVWKDICMFLTGGFVRLLLIRVEGHKAEVFFDLSYYLELRRSVEHIARTP
jgi:hypothetical protein